MDQIQKKAGPVKGPPIDELAFKNSLVEPISLGDNLHEQLESLIDSSVCSKTASKNDDSKKGESSTRCRWSHLHSELLRQAFQQFGNDREFLSKLFPGFSHRLVYRKIGEIKAQFEELEWLPKNDEILIKAILKGASNWNKIAKRYMPRKSVEQVLARVGHLKAKLRTQRARLELSGQSLGKHVEEDDSFLSTKHTDRTGEECINLLDDASLKPPATEAQQFSIPKPKDGGFDDFIDGAELKNLENDLQILGQKTDAPSLYFDWFDNTMTFDNSQMANLLGDLARDLDPS